MDFRRVKEIVIRFFQELKRNNLTPDLVVLFGSHAKGTSNRNSDIDIAVVSQKFGKDRLKEIAFLNKIALKIDPSIEAIPINTFDYIARETTSPILNEIKKSGVAIL